MKRYASLFVIFLIISIGISHLLAEQQTDELYTRRFALLVGANHDEHDSCHVEQALRPIALLSQGLLRLLVLGDVDKNCLYSGFLKVIDK